MLNNEAYLKTSPEVCTQILNYFDVVDNCIAMSDTNKQYSINPQTSYAPSPPIAKGSYTSVIISPNSNNTADIYNGFIKADLQVSVNIDKDINAANVGGNGYEYCFNKIWYGFKDARDAVEKYEIVANGITIYTQNYGCEESFLTSCCANETTKRADVYSKTRHKDVWNDKPGKRCGFVIQWDASKKIQTGTIHLKIDLRRFLPLSNIKYLPAFAGKIELRLYFSCAGMVYCPVGPSLDLKNNPLTFSKYKFENITNEFKQIGDNINCWVSSESTGTAPNLTYTIKSGSVISEVVDYEVKDCLSIIPCFGIIDNVYNALVQRYSNPTNPLTFPTQTISVYSTTNPLKQPTDKATVTITPRFVDSIFCLFPLENSHKTVFKNPLFKSFYISAGGYGNIPARAFGTTANYPEFLEYCQNAMNMNGEQTGFNKEVVASLINDEVYNVRRGIYSNDCSSFFIGLPTETDNTYQQGLSSLSPINFEINVSQGDNNEFAKDVHAAPLLCLLYDSSISILVQPNGMPPLVRIGNYDLTTPS